MTQSPFEVTFKEEHYLTKQKEKMRKKYGNRISKITLNNEIKLKMTCLEARLSFPQPSKETGRGQKKERKQRKKMMRN